MKLELKSVRNIRDFSEYGFDGFIRSASLSRLGKEDAALLSGKYNLRTIIDLRTSEEVEGKPDVIPPGVTYLHIPLFKDSVPGITHERVKGNRVKTERTAPDLCEMYRILVTAPYCRSQIGKVMEVIGNPDREGAVLWHCTEGKDRTGIIAAIFLLSRGVEWESVMEDYLLTNESSEKRAQKYYRLILAVGKGKELAGRVRDAFLAKREYLEAVRNELVAMAGSR